jgi:hypothetical protein
MLVGFSLIAMFRRSLNTPQDTFCVSECKENELL